MTPRRVTEPFAMRCSPSVPQCGGARNLTSRCVVALRMAQSRRQRLIGGRRGAGLPQPRHQRGVAKLARNRPPARRHAALSFRTVSAARTPGRPAFHRSHQNRSAWQAAATVRRSRQAPRSGHAARRTRRRGRWSRAARARRSADFDGSRLDGRHEVAEQPRCFADELGLVARLHIQGDAVRRRGNRQCPFSSESNQCRRDEAAGAVIRVMRLHCPRHGRVSGHPPRR